MGIKQWFIKPTPKQFVYTSFIYAIVFPVIGLFIASPIMASFMLLFFIFFAFGTMKYLKPIVPRQYYTNLIGAVPFLIILIFFLHSTISFTEIVESKSVLEQVHGIVPNEPLNRRVGKNSSSSLFINEIRLHCEYNERNSCSKAYDYSGQIADILYQPDTWIGNVVYEISVDDKKVYRYEDQLAYFKLEQRIERRQWFLTFMLFGIPSFWFYRQDKRLRKNTPKMTVEQELSKAKDLASNKVGCVGIIVGLVIITIAICAVLGGLIYLAVHEFGLAALCIGIAVICWALVIILYKPSSEL